MKSDLFVRHFAVPVRYWKRPRFPTQTVLHAAMILVQDGQGCQAGGLRLRCASLVPLKWQPYDSLQPPLSATDQMESTSSWDASLGS
jgi:hypothetical protein